MKKMFMISIGISAMINKNISPTDINDDLDIIEIINPDATHTIICPNPINKPTRKYPNMKW